MKRVVPISLILIASVVCVSVLAQSQSQPSAAVEPETPISPSSTVEHASPPISVATPAPYVAPVQTAFGAASDHSHNQTLIIRSSKADAEMLSMIREDMGIMTRILQREMGREMPGVHRGHASTLPLIGWYQHAQTESVQRVYLEDYGVLFLTSVSFPLKPSADEDENMVASSDSTWEEAKREMYGHGEAEQTEDYDPKKVERLKDMLLRAIRHATNIRNLSADSMITVVVSGHVRSNEGQNFYYKSGDGLSMYDVMQKRVVKGGSGQPTTLAIHARKSDVDAFAQDSISFEQFKQRTQILLY